MSIFNHEEKDPIQTVTDKIASTIGENKVKNKLQLKTSEEVKNITGPSYEFSVRIPHYEFIFRIITK